MKFKGEKSGGIDPLILTQASDRGERPASRLCRGETAVTIE
jgi:hypothetical protein